MNTRLPLTAGGLVNKKEKTMRKVTKKIAVAFRDGVPLTVDNSTTDGVSVFLHGNKIAWREGSKFFFTLAGWPTVTTRERLNGLFTVLELPLSAIQMNHIQYIVVDSLGEDMPTEYCYLTAGDVFVFDTSNTSYKII